MIIQHNMLAMNNINIGKRLSMDMTKITEKLSSGYKINRAADNAANLAISEKMNARIRALSRCQNNIEEGISLAQVADGALQEVNNMLVRVHELCVQAANGTNTEEDRGMIADEINQIYDDMERIFEDTEYNTMPVFQNDGLNFNAKGTGNVYTENVTKLPDGQYVEFGEMKEFSVKQFELAEEAKGATVTMTLDDEVDLNDASTLIGKEFDIKYTYWSDSLGEEFTSNVRCEFTKNWDKTTSSDCYISLDGIGTVQEAFDKLCTKCNNSSVVNFDFKNAVISQENGVNQVTFYLNQEDFKQSVSDGGVEKSYPIINGYGSIGNKAVISSFDGRNLEEVDSGDNQIKYSKDIYSSWYLEFSAGENITEKQKEALKENYLELSIDGVVTRVEFYDAEVDALQNADELRALFVEKFKALGCEASIQDGKRIAIRKNDCVSETKIGTEAFFGEVKKDGTEKYSNALTVNMTETVTPTLEQAGEWVIELPENLDSDVPFTLKINGENITFYSSDVSIRTNPTISGIWFVTCIGEKSPQEGIRDYLNARFDVTAVIKDNKLIISANNVNEQKLTIGSGDSVKYYTSVSRINEGKAYFTQDYSVSMDLTEVMSGSFDVKNLYGRGFVMESERFLYEQYFEFSDGTRELSGDNVKRIDISSCTSYDDITKKIGEVLGTRITVTNSRGILTITDYRTMEDDKIPAFSDGYAGKDGVFSNYCESIEKNFSGGTDVTKPYTELDFSNYTAENKSELYGHGFRVTCATCPGEFVNVMFCDDKSNCTYPESFEYTDDAGNTNTIKNYIVELKDISSGEQIVESIVKQLENDLDHFTEMEADGATLIVRDKRAGNMYDLNGVLQRASVISGIFANYEYKLEKEEGSGPPKKEYVGEGRINTDAYYSFVMIYASDTAENPYIPLHLPHLTLENLNLEKAGESFKNQKGVNEVMLQAQKAAEVVSMARSKIGADQNRLEHAFVYSANAEEKMAESYSEIRDTDMAEALTIQTKLSILSDVQQAMLSQIASQPEQVLVLLNQ